MSQRAPKADVEIIDPRNQEFDRRGREGAPPSWSGRRAGKRTLHHISEPHYKATRPSRSYSGRSRASFVDDSISIPPPPYHLSPVLRQPSYYSPPGRRHGKASQSFEYVAPYDPSYYDQFQGGTNEELTDTSTDTLHEDFTALHRVRNVSNKQASTLLPSFDAVIEVCTNVSRTLYLKIDALESRGSRRTDQIYSTAAELSTYAMVLSRLREVLSGSSQLISSTAYDHINSILLFTKKALYKIETVIAASRRTPSNFFRRDRLDSSLARAQSVRMNLECLKTSLAAMTSTIVLASRMKDRQDAEHPSSSHVSAVNGHNHDDIENTSPPIYELDSAVRNITTSLANDILANSRAISRWQQAELLDHHRMYLSGFATPVTAPISPASTWIESLVPPVRAYSTHKRVLPPPRSKALTYTAHNSVGSSSHVEVDEAVEEARIEGVIQQLLQQWTNEPTLLPALVSTPLLALSNTTEKTTEAAKVGDAKPPRINHQSSNARLATERNNDSFTGLEIRSNSGGKNHEHLEKGVEDVSPEISSAEDAGGDDEASEDTPWPRQESNNFRHSRVSSNASDSVGTPNDLKEGRFVLQVDQETIDEAVDLPQNEPRELKSHDPRFVAFDDSVPLPASPGFDLDIEQMNCDETGELEMLPRAGWEHHDPNVNLWHYENEKNGDSTSSEEAHKLVHDYKDFLDRGKYWYGSTLVGSSHQRQRSRSATGSTGFAETIIESSSDGPRRSSSRHRTGRRAGSRRYRSESSGSRNSRRSSPFLRARERQEQVRDTSLDGARDRPAINVFDLDAWVDSGTEYNGNKTFPRRGKTRIPKRIVRTEVLDGIGWPYHEEDDIIVVEKALSKMLIDKLLEVSRDHSEREILRNSSERSDEPVRGGKSPLTNNKSFVEPDVDDFVDVTEIDRRGKRQSGDHRAHAIEERQDPDGTTTPTNSVHISEESLDFVKIENTNDVYNSEKDVQDEGDYYNGIALERAYPGEAHHGAVSGLGTIDVPPGTVRVAFEMTPGSNDIDTEVYKYVDPPVEWQMLQVPPGTIRVTMDGAGGGRQEIIWQKYNGVRRCKFRPDGVASASHAPKEVFKPRRLDIDKLGGHRGWEAVDVLAVGSLFFAFGLAMTAY